jgi:Ca2+-binding RTX toxin-like protein
MRHASGATIFTTAALGLTAAGLTLVAPASAAAATCQGQPATIEATTNGQTLTGTDGPDVISTAGHTSVTVLAGDGDDLVCTDGGSLSGDPTAGVVHGGPGADTLVAASPQSRFDVANLDGDDGNDVLRVDSGPALLQPGPGDDEIHVPTHPALLDGAPAIWFSPLADTPSVSIDVPAGTIDGEGHDTFTGVLGFEGNAGPDVFEGGPGPDFFNDGALIEDPDPGADRVNGHGGDDRLVVLAGEADGGSGADFVAGMHSVVKGGAGPDLLRLSEGGSASGGPGADEILTDIDAEDVLGRVPSPFDLKGGAGPDRIFLSGPEDEIGFKPCAVRSRCSLHADGGPGADVLSFQRTGGRVHLDLAAGRTSYVGGHATVRRFEHVEGSHSADVLRGTARADHLDGNGGNDRLIGRSGPDVLHGGPGHDIADGGPGRDRCDAEVSHRC